MIAAVDRTGNEPAWIAKVKQCAWAWAVAYDQLTYVRIATLFAIAGLSPVPSPRETISSCVGRRAIAGQRWALAAERLFDGLAVSLGRQPGHCRRSIVRAEILLP